MNPTTTLRVSRRLTGIGITAMVMFLQAGSVADVLTVDPTTAADRGIECIDDVVDGADLKLVLAGWG